MRRKILVLSDNEILIERFRKLVREKSLEKCRFEYFFSYNNRSFLEKFADSGWIKPLNVKERTEEIIAVYDLVISLHCKQLFPKTLVENIKCINIHPGLNPHNRGWFPQVFSIINGLPCGATIHEIDEELDHGPIIAQEKINITAYDTSLTAYNKILDAEIDLIKQYIEAIIEDNYEVSVPEEGNVNLKKDYDKLCEIDLRSIDTFQNHINLLRALTHGSYKNAFFVDNEGNKIFLSLELKKED